MLPTARSLLPVVVLALLPGIARAASWSAGIGAGLVPDGYRVTRDTYHAPGFDYTVVNEVNPRWAFAPRAYLEYSVTRSLALRSTGSATWYSNPIYLARIPEAPPSSITEGLRVTTWSVTARLRSPAPWRAYVELGPAVSWMQWSEDESEHGTYLGSDHRIDIERHVRTTKAVAAGVWSVGVDSAPLGHLGTALFAAGVITGVPPDPNLRYLNGTRQPLRQWTLGVTVGWSN